MIKVYKYEKGDVHEVGVNELSSPATIWADCHNPTKADLQELSEKAGLNASDIKEALDKEERPRLFDMDNYTQIVFRAPYFENDEISTTPVTILISKKLNNVITLRLHELRTVTTFHQLIKDGKYSIFERGVSYFVYRFLDEIFNTYFLVLDEVEEQIDKIEDEVIEKPDKKTVRQIFVIKKTLIYFHKSLTANREVITAIEKEYASNITKRDIQHFRMLYHDVVQLIDMVATYRDVLTGTLDLYLSAVSQTLSNVMKKLTAMGSFVLIPTLIASVYVMNFRYLPELEWKYGYFFSLGLMVLSVTFLYIYFKKKNWL